MKKVFTFGAVAAVMCGAAAVASSSHVSPVSGSELHQAVITTGMIGNDYDGYQSITPQTVEMSAGVSIGTAEAIDITKNLYYLPSYFGDAEYVSVFDNGTYLGFKKGMLNVGTEEGNELWIECVSLVAFSSSSSKVTVPDAILVDGTELPVLWANISYNLYRGLSNSSTTVLTFPASMIYFNCGSYYFPSNIKTFYFLGDVPAVDGNNFVSGNSTQIFVCEKSAMSDFMDSDIFGKYALFPYGWDYDWTVVDVKKPGEFAELFLEANEYDWSRGINVKVTGNINANDVYSIKNLSKLQKLDLSETEITSIPAEFMRNRSTLLEVSLPATLTSIGSNAFSNCGLLSKVDAEGLLSIGNYAFQSCPSLADIDLSSVEYIGMEAFRDCVSLSKADLSGVKTIDSYAFLRCSSLKDLVFGSELHTIKTYAFQNCTSLETVSIPASLGSLPEYVFYGCSMLKDVVLPEGLVSIGYNAFYGCGALVQISLPSTLQSIGSGAFYNTGITALTCLAVAPPVASGSFIGSGMDMSRTYLYVPPFSKDIYRNTQYWSDFNLMRSVSEQIGNLVIDRPLLIEMDEETSEILSQKPSLKLTYGSILNEYGWETKVVGQVTVSGEYGMSVGDMNINAIRACRSSSSYSKGTQFCPTLITYNDKMTAENITVDLSLDNSYSDGNWYFISFPFDVKVSEILPSNNTYWVIRRYDSAARAAGELASTWVNLSEDDVMEAGVGYIVSAVGGEETYDQYGNYSKMPRLKFYSATDQTDKNIFRSDDVCVNLEEYASEFAHNRSWNLIGNPYLCYFDMHFLGEEFSAPVTVWNGSNYVAYSPVDDDLVLSPYESFFVQCPLSSNEMIFKEEGRLHSDAGRPLYKVPSMAPSIVTVEDRNVFNFNITSGEYADRARIVINHDAELFYEVGRDASKFYSDGNAPQLSVSADTEYSINERPLDDGLAELSLRAKPGTPCVLSLDGRFAPEWRVLVTDKATGRTVNLAESDYEFIAGEENGSRFTVKFEVAIQTGVSSVYDTIGADSDITVTSVEGTVVYEGRFTDFSVPSEGVYVITSGEVSVKAFLK